MKKLEIVEEDNMVSICCKGADSTLDGFIDIYPADELSPSLFESTKECKLFAEIIVKLLEAIM